LWKPLFWGCESSFLAASSVIATTFFKKLHAVCADLAQNWQIHARLSTPKMAKTKTIQSKPPMQKDSQIDEIASSF